VHAEERSKASGLERERDGRSDDRHRGAPPKILLIWGRAELDFVDGIPDEYLQATSTYEMTPEQRVEWEAEVRSLYYNGMVRIVVTPNWAKLIDFRDDSPERGRGTGPAAGGAAARLDPRVNMAHNVPYRTKRNAEAARSAPSLHERDHSRARPHGSTRTARLSWSKCCCQVGSDLSSRGGR
jgi:hypothetical protein